MDLLVTLESRQVLRHRSAECRKPRAQAPQPAFHLIVYPWIVDVAEAVSSIRHWTKAEETTIAEEELQVL